MFCAKCGLKNEHEAKFCSNCGKELIKSRFKSKKKRIITIVAGFLSILALVAIGFIIATIMNGTEKVAQIEVSKQLSPKNATKEMIEAPRVDPPKLESQKEEPLKENKPVSNEKEKTQIIKESQSRVYTIFTESGLGSGFLFENKGTVVTNAHVVAGYTEVIVRNVLGKKTTGRVIGISDKYDIALIQVDDYAGQTSLETEANVTEIGSEVIALGSPQGLENSASIGYLTGLDRSFESGFQYDNVYQVDAQISPGSSGGPLLDAKTGKVIGINSAILTADQSIGFSIPMYTMIDLLKKWSDSPMTSAEVASIFSFYDDYEYDFKPEGSAEADSYNEESEKIEEPEENQENTQDDSNYFDEGSLTEFVLYFRENYEMALYHEDFSFIEDLLLYDSNIYHEMAEYITEITNQGMIFEFTKNEVTGIVMEEGYAVVSTYEVFKFMNGAGEWSTYERTKDYSIVIDEYEVFRISDIVIFDLSL
ncbi:trypsin-like peptidase domain-containing protein [Paenisporosarcina antarctica]|uniref:Trypsin-like serine protease n=1 Tax=Paenisporosarcina antarctica TaxID=417367 RepID=A0A4V1AN84_9BACL|nr:trypsin-like peptidase domain-containing protein [Paenisporosarcina antarctica]QBP41885.1 trypsin-like serine protease [Paenisporosarcina antarctica]